MLEKWRVLPDLCNFENDVNVDVDVDVDVDADIHCISATNCVNFMFNLNCNARSSIFGPFYFFNRSSRIATVHCAQ